VIGGENAALLTKDVAYLDFPRSQISALMDLGIEKDGKLFVPQRHADPGKVNYKPQKYAKAICNEDGTAFQKDGWFRFGPMCAYFVAHVCNMSLDPNDLKMEMRLTHRVPDDPFAVIGWYHYKDNGGHDASWLDYVRGTYREYPEDILEHNLRQVGQRMSGILDNKPDPAECDFHYLPRPLSCEGLVQLTTGGLLPVYNGGLLITQVRHFDLQRRRPGLPLDVGALVTRLSAKAVTIQLVNLNLEESRDMILQAGGMGEHRFTTASYTHRAGDKAEKRTDEINGKFLHVHLPAGGDITLELGMERFVNDPSYRLPWGKG
jgi:hypothetical protein